MLVAAIILLNAWMTHKYYFNFLNSDDASELVYARLLAREGKIISSNMERFYRNRNSEYISWSILYCFILHQTFRWSGLWDR